MPDPGREYRRDLAAGLTPCIPVNYYPDDDPDQTSRATWRSHGHLLFSNWLNLLRPSADQLHKVEDIGGVHLPAAQGVAPSVALLASRRPRVSSQ